MLPVAVDAMGGDDAPDVIVAGARTAASNGTPVVVVGPSDLGDRVDLGGLELIEANEIIEMDEDGGRAVRRKKDSTLVRAAEAVRDGRASAMVSAGNTGATMASALLRMGRVKGVSRPAIATIIPVPGASPTVLLDAAHADVVVEAIGLALEQGGPATVPGSLDGHAGRLVDGHGIHAIDDHAGHAVARCAVGHIDDGLVVGLGRVLAVAVVFTHEQHRQLIQASHVGGFVERAFIGGTIAEEGDGNPIVAFEPVCETGAHGNGRTAADDAVGAQHPECHVGNVHGAALALAVARGPTVELGEHGTELAAFGDQVAVTPVGAGDPVFVAQVSHDAGSHGFLAHVKVQSPRYFAVFHEFARPLFKEPDADHATVEVFQRGI